MSINSETASIRRATPEDAAIMAPLGAATFTETFGHLYPPEDLQEFLARSHTPESWARTLSDPKRGVIVVEHQSGRKIGFIVVGACKLPAENLEATSVEIQQLYVLAEFH